MSEETLRDTFAAAALTGLMRKLRPGSVFDLTITARQAFEVADAMLRERARNNTQNDAVPAADGEGIRHNEHSRVRASANCTGDTTREPVLWGLSYGGRPVDSDDVYELLSQAETAKARCTRWPCEIVPLYRDTTPTLADAERKALERQASWLASDESFACDMMRKDAATLRALLARLGGAS